MGGNKQSICIKVVKQAVKTVPLSRGLREYPVMNGLIATQAKIQSFNMPALGQSAPVASIFGNKVEAGQILGINTTNVNVQKISNALLYGGAVIVSLMVAAGCNYYYVYTRKKRLDDIIEQAYSRTQLNIEEILGDIESIVLPTFKPIFMSKEQFDELQQFTSKDFASVVKDITCPFSKQVMRQPRSMKCCQDKFAEKMKIQAELQETGKCIFCHNKVDKTFILKNATKECTILGFRSQLVKLYINSRAQYKQLWEYIIDQKMGKGYTQNHLKKFKLSQ